MKECDCIVAFHIGHSSIQRSEAKRKMIVETCCGGVMLLAYCPKCGNKIKDKNKFQNWQNVSRKKEVKERIKYYKGLSNQSDFANSMLESYEEELRELNDVEQKGDE